MAPVPFEVVDRRHGGDAKRLLENHLRVVAKLVSVGPSFQRQGAVTAVYYVEKAAVSVEHIVQTVAVPVEHRHLGAADAGSAVSQRPRTVRIQSAACTAPQFHTVLPIEQMYFLAGMNAPSEAHQYIFMCCGSKVSRQPIGDPGGVVRGCLSLDVDGGFPKDLTLGTDGLDRPGTLRSLTGNERCQITAAVDVRQKHRSDGVFTRNSRFAADHAVAFRAPHLLRGFAAFEPEGVYVVPVVLGDDRRRLALTQRCDGCAGRQVAHVPIGVSGARSGAQFKLSGKLLGGE